MSIDLNILTLRAYLGKGSLCSRHLPTDLAEAFQGLDASLSQGGVLPKDWVQNIQGDDQEGDSEEVPVSPLTKLITRIEQLHSIASVVGLVGPDLTREVLELAYEVLDEYVDGRK